MKLGTSHPARGVCPKLKKEVEVNILYLPNATPYQTECKYQFNRFGKRCNDECLMFKMAKN